VWSLFLNPGTEYGFVARLREMFRNLHACERMIATSPITATPNPDLDLPEPPATIESAVHSTRQLLFNLGIYDREMARLRRSRTPLIEAISYFIRDFRSYRSVLEGSALPEPWRSGPPITLEEAITEMRIDVSEKATKIPLLIPSIEPINRHTQIPRSQLIRIEERAYAFKSRLASLGTTDPECNRLLGYIFETSRNMDEMSHPLKALDKELSELVALEPELAIDNRIVGQKLGKVDKTGVWRDYDMPKTYRQQFRHNVALLDEIRKLAGSYPPSRAQKE
jgi:hypothetical protein